MQKIELKNLNETRAWAREFAKTLCAPATVALHGDLGMGKTEISRSMIQSLTGADTVVPSPTFTIVQTYEAKDNNSSFGGHDGRTIKISHFDLYRITDKSELMEIGLQHAMDNDITLIEWPQIASDILPGDTIHLYITQSGEDGRLVEIK